LYVPDLRNVPVIFPPPSARRKLLATGTITSMSTEADNDDSGHIPGGRGQQLAAPVDYSDTATLPFPVVGIGASAGGIQAVCELLENMPQDSGMALVVIQHLPPDHQSMLSEIFARHTRMPVLEIEDGMKLAPNCVYVIRPAFSVTMDGGTFSLGEPVEERGHRRPIDDFYRSLARVQREKAIAVVLSGVGTNGTSGAQAIKAAGGVCIAQDPDTADFSGMPRSLINSGYADQVCKVAEIPQVLTRYIQHPYVDPSTRGREHAEAVLRPDKEYLTQIFAILRTRTGHNFNGYKKPTVLRRIQRRMGLRGTTDLPTYAEHLRDDLDEARALANDLMINVTGFFRDPEAWEGLRTSVITPLIERSPADGSIRAWVTACASGEEAYSLGMLLIEEMERQNKQLEIKIFATDTADKALAFARAGIYPTGIEGDLDQDRLDRFFDKEEHTYRVKKALRDSVVFAAHDVLRDPPFSRVDICTCRNLLIYLEPEVQQRVVFMLHFALREAGYLFLGSAETPGAGEKLFDTVSKKWRIYQRTNASHHPFDLAGFVSATVAHPGRRDLIASLPVARGQPTLAIQQALLDQMTPATIVVDRTDRVVYFSANTSPYVIQPSGEPTRDVFELMKPELRAAARTALRRAAAKGEPVTILVETSDALAYPIHLTAAPLPTSKPSEFFRLTFERAPDTQSASEQLPSTNVSRAPSPILPGPEETGLEDELRIMRRELQSTVEAFEASNEELKASHEEVVSINEELQSANEELETGKEELQSLNEELITVNAQLQAKIAELEATTNDLSNLLSSTNIAVVFLDTQFRVRLFTPAVYDLLELIPGDIGRPIANLAQKFGGGGLLEDARAVLARLIPLETEVLSNSGCWYLRRTLPYRTADNHIDGVVITFVDITARRRAEQALESSQMRLQAIIDQMPVAMLMVDAANGTLLHANRPAAQLMNLPYPVPTIGSEWKLAASSFQGTHPDGRPFKPQDWPLAQSLAQGIAVPAQEIEFRHPDGTNGVLSMSSTPVLDADGKIIVAVATMFDITEQRLASQRLSESEQRLQLLIDSALDYAIFMIDLENRVISWNRGAERLLGWSEEEAIGRGAALIFTPEDRSAGVPEKEIETAKRDGRAVDERVHVRKSGERFWANGMLMCVYDDKGTLCRYAKIIRDETERKRAEENLQRALQEAERVRASAESANRAKDEFISTISHELRTPLNTIRLWVRMLGSERLSEQDRIDGVRMIDRSAEAQQHLIDDLLDVSRMSSGQLRLNLRQTRLADVAHSAIESVRPSADVRKVQIVSALSPDVGVARADPERIQQVLLNLISNAVKFTPGGGRIEVQMTRSNDDVIIVVKDSGIGIRAEFLPHVFERFRQAEIVTTRQHGGLGLGLAIAKQLVELHGGTITADSEGEGKGATFTATLPLPKLRGEDRDTPANLDALTRGIDNLRILLVEDDSGSRLATCRALELRGANMDAVPNASLAMSAYTQTPPHAMILDIGLPVEDGYSLIARIRELEAAKGLPRAPAIALTAFARTHDRERAFAAGFDEHLAKPVDIDTLVAALLRLTRRDRR
jgi:two-component system CheB/CheR fusion protein